MINLNIYVSHGTDGDKKILYINTMNFDTSLPMYACICIKDIHFDNIKDEKSLIY